MGDYAKARNFTFVVLAESEMGPTKEFALDQVELLDDYYLTAQNSDIEFLKKFDNDRLLSRFRETAGLDTKKLLLTAAGKMAGLAVIVSDIILRR